MKIETIIPAKIVKISLSRRNLLYLLSCLDNAWSENDRKLYRRQGADAPVLIVEAQEDAQHYGTRRPGEMHPSAEAYIREHVEPGP